MPTPPQVWLPVVPASASAASSRIGVGRGGRRRAVVGAADQHGPILGRLVRRCAEPHDAAALQRGDAALLQDAAGLRIEPGHAEAAAQAGQVEARRPAGRQVDEVGLAALGEDEIVAGARQGIIRVHPPERHIILEELAGHHRLPPHLGAAVDLFRVTVAVARPLREVEFRARPAADEIFPEILLADDVVVEIDGIGRGSGFVVLRSVGIEVGDLVHRHHPWAVGGVALGHPFHGLGVRLIGLQAGAVHLVEPHERPVALGLHGRVGVDDNGMVVGVHGLDEGGERLALGIRVRVLLAEVPLKGRAMAEAGDQLAVVDAPLDPQRAAVQQLVVLLFLMHDVQHHTLPGHLVHDDAPLVQLEDVVGGPVGLRGPRPHVLRVALHVHREEIQCVLSVSGDGVDEADDPFPLAAPPGRITLPPILHVGRVGMGRRGAVESGVGQQILGRADAGLQEVRAVAGKPIVILADILQEAAPADVVARLVRPRDAEGSRLAVHEAGRGSAPRRRRGRHVGPSAKAGAAVRKLAL